VRELIPGVRWCLAKGATGNFKEDLGDGRARMTTDEDRVLPGVCSETELSLLHIIIMMNLLRICYHTLRTIIVFTEMIK